MKRIQFVRCIQRMFLSVAGLCLLASVAKAEDGFVPLFDGKTLEGWNNPYDFGKAWVDEGTIALQADKKFFLVTDKKFSDFILEAEIMLPPEGPSNSGIMFRCHVEKNKVFGYQAECDPKDRAWSGGFYDEGRRKWMHPTGKEQPPLKLVKAPLGEWIKYRIEAKGDHLQIFVNGTKTTDIRDDVDASGHIGLQHHGEKGQIYRFRNVRLKDLSKPAGG